MEVNYNEIGDRIRKIRKSKKIAQEKLAEMTDYSVTHISHIETGSAKASIEILKVSAALGCTPNDILCDSMAGAKETFLNQITEKLVDCTEFEIRVISDVVNATKQSLRLRKNFFENQKRMKTNRHTLCFGWFFFLYAVH